MKRLAIISSHPIQYYAPWFRYLTRETDIELKVFYLWDFGVTEQIDSGFEQAIKWDIPLLEGYSYEFVPNTSRNPGTSHFWGLQNPTLLSQVKAFSPAAVLMMNYNYASLYRFIWQWPKQATPLLFRGDSHRLSSSFGLAASLKERLRRQWISGIYRQFSGLLFVGKANARYFSDHGVSPERLFFSPHSIDNQRFFAQRAIARAQAKAWKAELGIPSHHRVILFAGKFSTKKRPLDLLKAFVAAELPNVSLLFVGAGPLDADLKAAAAPYNNIYLAPFQNQSYMPRTYAAGDVFVLPSYGNGETWGLAVNEAMCLGCSIIASDHVGCVEDLVQRDRNGLVFPAGDIPALTAAIKKTLSNSQRLEEWGNHSQEIIRSYSYAQMTVGLQQALEASKPSSELLVAASRSSIQPY
ncbi:MAG: glycosyl transferase [Leptolyngbya foveolarum]|uniref:Glycosyl transferase n=1 Tax=Leptolyngbya foveolarum TaxID=47253 RepID=A0A2W4UAP4_9CYAN|nr:MAG: glycosyl transferase [Leptolyngbya foveolarum]